MKIKNGRFRGLYTLEYSNILLLDIMLFFIRVLANTEYKRSTL